MRSDVAVLGLGQMGSALAEAFLRAGHRVTVWNRSPAKAEPLVAQGAQAASSAVEAQRSAPVVVACVLDYPALTEILDPERPGILVNLTSGSPEQAREMARRGGRYVDGGIMTTPPGIGDQRSMILYSGDQDALAEASGLLSALAEPINLGADPGLAALYDTALLGIMWSTLTGWLHAAALVTADGATAEHFTPLATRWLGPVAGFISSYAPQVDSGSYPGSDATLDVHLATLDHLVHASEVRKVDAALPRLLHDYARRAVESGHGADGWARIIELLRAA
ncbi:3-hydroxyisobutyrate dehydrogenase-like beta-hydroxyacid dehydrogenase [Lentzea atacamensis]|uniref:3-hydroxyisobutyrate dehydrogenase-like beta-hydroxyacid dehydrogenase n=1 Tax=Lentzea atacamensis TaxID=531938 RepID=A0ABX9E0B9_9PSEU|nr:NAD(P)-binding domain-containing protein [Lentzea atacamensis]RAS61743.1 3-hydroxyisobutyrate dehydrogenase-like beta-hydroxyacid dehydrogenase [Lentzea atacamensis]